MSDLAATSLTLPFDVMAEQGIGVVDHLIGARVAYTTYEGAVLLGRVESFDGSALGMPVGFPIIRFDDGRWARGDGTLHLVSTL